MNETTTQSEALFEDFCRLHAIPFQRISVGAERTADYRILPSGEEIICEIKEIESSAEEKKAEAAQEAGEVAVFGGTIGKRVRKKITDGAPQISALAKGQCPGVLVLWEAPWVPRHLDPYNIKAAMYGFDTVVLGVPMDSTKDTRVMDKKSGEKRKVTVSHNTSLSAIAALRTIEDRIECRVYHNRFATIPLRPELLSLPNVWHYKLREKQLGQFDEWECVATHTENQL